MKALLSEIFYRPVFNALIAIYNALPHKDLGVAIIILTLLIRVLLWPIAQRALKSQKALQDLQPKIEDLKKEYGDRKEDLAKAMMELYSKEKVSPMSSCLPLLIQLPVFIGLNAALSHGIKSNGFDALYPFVHNPGTINPTFLGIMSLSASSLLLAVIAGVMQFMQARMMITRRPPAGTPGSADEQALAVMNAQMLYVMPVLTVYICMRFTGGLALYWTVSNGISIIQQWFVMGRKSKT